MTFAPCFLWIFLGGRYIEHARGVRALTGALTAITAAVVGVILNPAIWFAIHTIVRTTWRIEGYGFACDAPVLTSLNPFAFALALAAVIAMFRLRTGMLQTLAACSAAGILLYLTGAPL